MPKPAITRVPNLAITPVSTNKNNGLYAPQLTTAQRDAIPAATLVNGAIIYNTSINLFQSYQNGAWYTLTTSPTTVTGVGLVAGSAPFILPSGTAAAVEVAANQVAGFMYYNTTANTVKLRTNAAWVTVQVA